MAWLHAAGVRNVDLWRTDIDALNATNGTEQWVYDGLASFLRNGLNEITDDSA